MNAPWDIIHVDLSRGIPSSAPTERDALMVLWWRDLPLGQLQLEAGELLLAKARHAGGGLAESHAGGVQAERILQTIAPALDAYLSASQLESHRWHPLDQQADPRTLLQAALALLDSVSSASISGDSVAPEARKRKISIVVPTRNRPDQLAACLRSLATLRDKPLEVIVVDNAPSADDSPEPSATRRVAETAGARYVAEPRRGSSAARNAGVAASHGELIAFGDDDETVHPHWLGRLAQCFRDPEIGLVTGLVLPAELETEAQRIFEHRYSFARGYVARTFDAELYRSTRRRGVPVWEIGGSGNMAIRRDVFDRLGGFDERLGAGRAGGCEELELFYRALAAGWSCHYEPRAVTHHQHRRDLASLKRQLRAYMRGHVAAALTQWTNHRDTGNLHHLLWTLPRVYAGYALRCLLGDRTYRPSHLAAEIAGCLSGVSYYRRHRIASENLDDLRAGTVAVTTGA